MPPLSLTKLVAALNAVKLSPGEFLYVTPAGPLVSTDLSPPRSILIAEYGYDIDWPQTIEAIKGWADENDVRVWL